MTAEETVRLGTRHQAERDIKALVYEYARLCDDGYNPGGIAALFTEDGQWSAASQDGRLNFGSFVGRTEIEAFFASLEGQIGPRTFHAVMAPRIEVAESLQEGRGDWSAITIMERRAESGEREVAMLAATYEHDYRRHGDQWLFARLKSVIIFDQTW